MPSWSKFILKILNTLFNSPPQGSDRLGRLTRHILRQQSLYPLYPAPEGMCIDQEQAETHARLPCNPHVLVLPSDLRYFVRVSSLYAGICLFVIINSPISMGIDHVHTCKHLLWKIICRAGTPQPHWLAYGRYARFSGGNCKLWSMSPWIRYKHVIHKSFIVCLGWLAKSVIATSVNMGK